MGSYLCNCLTWLPVCCLNLSGPGSQSVSIFIDPGEAHSLNTVWHSLGAEALGSSKLLFPIAGSFIAVRLEGLPWDLLFNLVKAWKWRKTAFWQTNYCLLLLLVSFVHLSKEEPDGEMRGTSLKAWQYALCHDFLNTTDRKTLISQRLFETPRLQFKILLFAFLTSPQHSLFSCRLLSYFPSFFFSGCYPVSLSLDYPLTLTHKILSHTFHCWRSTLVSFFLSFLILLEQSVTPLINQPKKRKEFWNICKPCSPLYALTGKLRLFLIICSLCNNIPKEIM